MKPLPRLKLQGFNNLTKALSFNIYDICYAVTPEQRDRYIEYIDEQYDSDRLTNILTDVAEIIGANILNVARQPVKGRELWIKRAAERTSLFLPDTDRRRH